MYFNRKGLQFSRYDAMDYITLQPIILSWVKKHYELASTHGMAGVPPSIAEKYEDIDEAHKEWLSILEFIVSSLEAKEPDYAEGFHEGPNNGKREKYGIVWDMVPNDETAWSTYMVEKMQWGERRVKAMELFGKHFHDMWI